MAATNRNDRYQSALGHVLYREGHFQEARDALEKALGYSFREYAEDLFALAMTQSALKEPTEARSTYDRAVERMNESAPKYPPYVALRDEAAELLGLQP